MVQPIDYTVKTVDPTEAFTKTLGLYQGLEQGQQTIEANKLTIEAARQKIEADKAGQERLRQVGELVNRAISPGATLQDVQAAMIHAGSREQYDGLTSIYATMDKDKREGLVKANLPIYAALVNGQPDRAIQALETRRDAYTNSGDTANAAKHSAWIDAIKADPKAADAVQVEIGALMGADKDYGAPAVTAVLNQRKAKPEFELATAQAEREGYLAAKAKVDADNAPAMAKLELAGKRLGNRLTSAQIEQTNQDINDKRAAAKRLQETGGYPLTAASQATVNKLVTESVANQQMGLNNLDFASRVAESNIRGGLFGNANKFMESIGGDVNLLRIEGKRLINSSLVSALPTGAASDGDIKLTQSGFPENANATKLASYMRGTAKIKLIEAQQQSDTAEWLSLNGTLGPARKPMVVGGRQVNAGETLTKYNARSAVQIVQDVNKQMRVNTPNPVDKPTFRQPTTAASKPGWGKASVVPGA